MPCHKYRAKDGTTGKPEGGNDRGEYCARSVQAALANWNGNDLRKQKASIILVIVMAG